MNLIPVFSDNWFVLVPMFIIGLVLIVKGGDLFVDAASWLAEVSGIPKFIIGATVVSLATTLPELLTSLFATIRGTDLAEAGMMKEAAEYLTTAAGNAIGSVTANIGLIMAISLICIPSGVKRRDFAPQAFMMILSAVVLSVFAFTQKSISILPSIILLVIFAVFMYNNIRMAMRDRTVTVVEISSDTTLRGREIGGNVAKFIIGAAAIVIGADVLVNYGVKIAEKSGVPANIIAITMIAIGTSLPELVTTLTAIAKKQSSLSVGNIIGANIFDLTLILSICSFVSGGRLEVEASTYMIDLPVSLLVGLIAVLPPLITKKFHRVQGFVLIVVYIGYVVFSCLDPFNII